MVSAPHAINQFRNGQVKWADMYTGGITICKNSRLPIF